MNTNEGKKGKKFFFSKKHITFLYIEEKNPFCFKIQELELKTKLYINLSICDILQYFIENSCNVKKTFFQRNFFYAELFLAITK